jgi:hypothetical protein
VLGALIVVTLLLTVVACRQGVPVIDTTPRPPTVDGTISGTVRGPQGTSPVEGRTVEVINVETGERQRLANTGGFTFKVKPGRYRVQLHLQPGETIVKAPGVINVNRSDVDAHADFVLGVSRTARPRYPRLRGDDGLGSPIT